MRGSIAAPLAALVALGMLVVPARAGPISGTFTGDATLTPVAPGVFLQTFNGEGDDTRLGSFDMQAQSTIDFSHPPNIIFSNGMFSEFFSEGTLDGTSSGMGTASGHGTATFVTETVFTGGTERFREATGEATVTGTIVQTSPTTDTITASYVGSLTIVPEPSSLALLALGTAALAGWQRWKGRHALLDEPFFP